MSAKDTILNIRKKLTHNKGMQEVQRIQMGNKMKVGDSNKRKDKNLKTHTTEMRMHFTTG